MLQSNIINIESGLQNAHNTFNEEDPIQFKKYFGGLNDEYFSKYN